MKTQKSIIAIIALFIFAAAASAQVQYRDAMDFDGDNKADLTVMRKGAYNAAINGYARTWYSRASSNGQFRVMNWGFIPGYHEDGLFESDVIQPGDYDGDNKADYAVVRLVNDRLVWHVTANNGTNYRVVTFGIDSGKRDVPMAADYDGDGKTDIAVARRGLQGLTWTWHVLFSSNGQHLQKTVPVISGLSCKPVPGDYDGDSKADFTQYCSGSDGMQSYYKTVRSSDDATTVEPWGTVIGPNWDRVTMGDYDGDGKTDLAVMRWVGTSEFNVRIYWYIKRSSDGAVVVQQFGAHTETVDHQAAQGDYDGDGKTDIAVYDVNSGTYYILQSTNGQVRTEKWGVSGDIMLTNQPYIFNGY